MAKRMSQSAQKEPQQIELEKSILSKIKTKNTQILKGVKFSAYTYFTLSNGLLQIYLKQQIVKNKESNYIPVFQNPILQNMQTDATAFEGWAICLKTWLPDDIQRVVLKWDVPTDKQLSETKSAKFHYNRFKYRVMRFSEAYKWFSIDHSNDHIIKTFKKEWEDSRFTINSSSKKIDEQGRKKDLCETQVEFDIVHQNTNHTIMTNRFDLDVFDRQFPVGVRRIESHKDVQFFNGRGSAIDLYGYKNGTLSIFELKYIKGKGTAENKKVGIISELFFYANIIRDIALKKIESPKKRVVNDNSRSIYDSNINKIKAMMLSNKYHPLVTSDTLNTLNECSIDGISIIYDRIGYKWDIDDKRITICE